MKKLAWSALKSLFQWVKTEIHETIIFLASLYCIQVLSEAFVNESQSHDLTPKDYLYYGFAVLCLLFPNSGILVMKKVFQAKAELASLVSPKSKEDLEETKGENN